MLLSLITPVGIGTDLEYLRQSYASIRNIQSEYEWVIQFDGPEECFDASHLEFLTDQHVNFAFNSEKSGVMITRNNALARARGFYCISLDSDDLIISEGIDTMLQEAQGLDDIDFIIGECLDLFPSGKQIRRFKAPKLSPGHIDKWDLLKLWLVEGSLFFQPGPVMYRTKALQGIGGWPHLPSVKDFELISTLLHVEGRGSGRYTGCDIYLYRQHRDQNTRTTHDIETALETIKFILSKNPDSPEAIQMLNAMEHGDTSLVSISQFFSREWHEANKEMMI